MAFAGAGYLTYLRSFGFKTFRDLFDEGYDNEVDPILRIEKITNLCKSLKEMDHVQLYEQARPILEHNRNLFFDTQHLESLNIDTLHQIKDHFARKQ